jgi:hypothetical protein
MITVRIGKPVWWDVPGAAQAYIDGLQQELDSNSLLMDERAAIKYALECAKRYRDTPITQRPRQKV